MPHVVASMDELNASHTSWDVIAAHPRLFVSFGGIPEKNAQVSPGGAGNHRLREGLRRAAEAGVRFVNIGPVAGNLDTGGEVEWPDPAERPCGRGREKPPSGPGRLPTAASTAPPIPTC